MKIKAEVRQKSWKQMIADMQNVTLGNSVDPNAAGQAKAAPDLSSANGISFRHVLVRGDAKTAPLPDTVARFTHPSDADPSKPDTAIENQSVELPRADMAIITSNVLYFGIENQRSEVAPAVEANSADTDPAIQAVIVPENLGATPAVGLPTLRSQQAGAAEQVLKNGRPAKEVAFPFSSAPARLKAETNDFGRFADAQTVAVAQAAANDRPPVASQSSGKGAGAMPVSADWPPPAIATASRDAAEPATGALVAASNKAMQTSLSAATGDRVATIGLSNAENLWRTHCAPPDPMIQENSTGDASLHTPAHDADVAVLAIPNPVDARKLALPQGAVSNKWPETAHLPVANPQPAAYGAARPTAAPSPTLDAGPAFASPEIISIFNDLTEAGFAPAGSAIPASATAATATAPSAFAPAPTLGTNLAPLIVEMAQNRSDGPIDLALAPEELGRLTISLRQEGDFVRVSMMAERPETLDLLRRHAGDLLADLRQSGFSGASFSFGQSAQDPTPRSAGAATATDVAAPPQPPPVDYKPAHPGPAPTGAGLDLRL